MKRMGKLWLKLRIHICRKAPLRFFLAPRPATSNELVNHLRMLSSSSRNWFEVLCPRSAADGTQSVQRMDFAWRAKEKDFTCLFSDKEHRDHSPPRVDDFVALMWISVSRFPFWYVPTYDHLLPSRSRPPICRTPSPITFIAAFGIPSFKRGFCATFFIRNCPISMLATVFF